MMAKLFFRYSSMGAGKSLEIIRIAENYKRQNKEVLCLVPDIVGEIKYRIGVSIPAISIKQDTDIKNVVTTPISCVLIDEAQFLTKDQVIDLTTLVDLYDIPVICYGLKNDFQNELFEGSKYLLLYADKIEEIKTTCYFCNNKATMVLRINNGKPVYEGRQVEIEKTNYLPVCRKHWFQPGVIDIGEVSKMTIEYKGYKVYKIEINNGEQDYVVAKDISEAMKFWLNIIGNCFQEMGFHIAYIPAYS